MDARILTHLLRSKGLWHLPRRLFSLTRRLGITTARFETSLDAIAAVLAHHQVAAAFPTTAAALERHPAPLQRLAARGIELAIHSYHHIDLSLQPPAAQRDQLLRARRAFEQCQIPVAGFRAPYLRWNNDLRRLLFAQGFSYDSSACALWPVLSASQAAVPTIQTALAFYRPLDAGHAPVLPRLLPEGLVEIPVSLPDDEMLVDRLNLPVEQIAAIWTDMLRASHQAGELLTLQLHPERGSVCAPALDALLSAARALQPHVWIATLAQTAEWWRIRPQCQIRLQEAGVDRWQVQVEAPAAARVIAQGSLHIEPAEAAPSGALSAWPFAAPVQASQFTVHSPQRPFVGIAPGSAPELLGFLRQQGYIVEISANAASYPVHFDWPAFDPAAQGRAVVAAVEAPTAPLLRFSRWPHAARSALVISGDIDALTLWDYLRRPFEA